MVEYVIKEYGQDILVSGLDTNNNKAILKITTKENVKNELIFDALLWYFFYPIVAENASCDLSHLLLLST